MDFTSTATRLPGCFSISDLKYVQSFLRHADSSTTGLYVHSDMPVVEGVEILAEEILSVPCPTVPKITELVS